MSNCLEYLDLHHSYIQTLRRWSEAALINDELECRAAEQDRDIAFRRVSRHRESCPQCEMEAIKGSKNGIR
jgi:hypothetical protein